MLLPSLGYLNYTASHLNSHKKVIFLYFPHKYNNFVFKSTLTFGRIKFSRFSSFLIAMSISLFILQDFLHPLQVIAIDSEQSDESNERIYVVVPSVPELLQSSQL
jgi:hypothetical protein